MNVKTTRASRSLFFHLTYHPDDPPSSQIQRIFRETIFAPQNEPPLSILRNRTGSRLEFDALTICYSRPCNLGNMLTPRRIRMPAATGVSDHVIAARIPTDNSGV